MRKCMSLTLGLFETFVEQCIAYLGLKKALRGPLLPRSSKELLVTGKFKG